MLEMKKPVGYIVTYTGKVFDLLDPKPDTVCIEDIAHALSNICRYTGHTKQFYSVAQHSVLMATTKELPGDPLQKLLHDAAEAYIGDMASPWKRILRVEIPGRAYYHTVKIHEHRIQKVIEKALEVDLTPSAEVKESDIRMFWTEVRDLMSDMSEDFEWGPPKMPPIEKKIIPWQPSLAEGMFLSVYNRLKG
ncbi:MAG: hypothetical protein A7316_10235 [Candidatus Altiarchaeales archaeon WOR_SM1_86-2]|nr:MAG: hypothetical protein A7316_10235 [Candidatus Altiarchaeales archaeon WOR_SM1_86-2]